MIAKATPSRPRLDWLDYARAIGIALIVLGHANRSVDRTAGLGWSSANQALDTLLYSFHVPLFFLLSGIAIGLGRSGFQNMSRGLLWGLVYPYVLWSVIWIGLKASLPASTLNVPVSWTALLQIAWAPVEHLWFLYHLFFIRLIWYFGELTLGTQQRALTIVALGLLAAGLRVLGEAWAGPAHFIENFIFFGLGLLFVGADRGTYSVPVRVLWLSAALLALGLTFEIQFPEWSLRLATGVAGSLIVAGLCQRLPASAQGQPWKLMAHAGQASLAIYLVHGIVIGGMRPVLKAADMLDPLSLLLAGTIAGLIVPFLLYVGLERASSKSGRPLLKWAGLGVQRLPAAAPPAAAAEYRSQNARSGSMS